MKKITRISCIGTPWALGQSTVSPTADESFNVSGMEERHFVHSVSFREALNLDRCGVGSDDWCRKATPEIRVHIAEAAVDPAAAPRTLSLSSSQLGGSRFSCVSPWLGYLLGQRADLPLDDSPEDIGSRACAPEIFCNRDS